MRKLLALLFACWTITAFGQSDGNVRMSIYKNGIYSTGTWTGTGVPFLSSSTVPTVREVSGTGSIIASSGTIDGLTFIGTANFLGSTVLLPTLAIIPTHGTQAELDSTLLEQYEIGITTDTLRIYVGSGTSNTLLAGPLGALSGTNGIVAFSGTVPAVITGTNEVVYFSGSGTPGKISYSEELANVGVQGANIPADPTIDLGAATGQFVVITGIADISALGTASAGITRSVRFDSTPTLIYNATSLILPEATDKSVASGDAATFVSLGSGNWVCTSYFSRVITAYDVVLDPGGSALSVSSLFDGSGGNVSYAQDSAATESVPNMDVDSRTLQGAWSGTFTALTVSGTLRLSGTSAAPSNTVTPAAWTDIVISGTTFKVPLYQ